jgi:hypothetical protein
MAFVRATRTRERTSTSGTADIELNGLLKANERLFIDAIGDGNTTTYGVVSGDGTGWEEGIGTIHAGTPNTFSRDIVLRGSAGAGTKISLAGESRIFCNFMPQDVHTVGGPSWHQRCELATTGALPACTYDNGDTGYGATLTANANGALSIDGIAVVAGHRILVKDQVDTTQNGIYVATNAGGASAEFVLTRATDYDQGFEIFEADVVAIGAAGTANGRTLWTMFTTDTEIELGTTDISWSLIGARPSETLDVFGAALGGVLYRGPDGWATLAPGDDGQVLTVISGYPEWADATGGGGGGGAAVSDGGDWDATAAYGAGTVVRDPAGRFFEASEDIPAASGVSPDVLGVDLQGNQGASTTRSLTTSGDVTMIVAYLGLNSGATVTGITCSLGSFEQRATYPDGGNSTEIWFLKIPPTTLAALSITASFSANVDFVLFYAGISEATGFDLNSSLPARAAGNTITGVSTTSAKALFLFISRSSGLGFDSTKDPTGFTHWGGNTYLPTTSDASYKQLTTVQSGVTINNSAAGSTIASTIDAVTSDNPQPIADPRWVMLSTIDNANMDGKFGTARGTIAVRGASAWSGLAAGAANRVLATDGSNDPQWKTVSAVLDAVGATRGQILTRGPAGWGVLSAGTAGNVLTMGSLDPTWAAPPGSGSAGLFSQLLSITPTSAGTGLTTWLNQGTATVSDAAAGILLTVPSTAGNSLRCRTMAAPSTPYTKTALIGLTSPPKTDTGRAGFGWYDGSAKLQALTVFNSGANGYGIDVENWTNVTTFSSSPYGVQPLWASPVWLRISDDGTTVKFQFSSDGMGWTTLYSIAKASGFLGSSGYSNIVFFANGNGVDTYASLLSFS